jgi:hypothetical protein
MSEKIFAIVSVYDNPELLPHFLSHYSRLGVDHIFVSIRTPIRNALYETAAAVAQCFPATIHWIACEQFSDSDKAEVEQVILRQNDVQPDDYIMHLDLDEFQEYPVPVIEVVRQMNVCDDWALRGWIVDRVAEGGWLVPVLPEPSIGEQFPIGCAVSQILLHAWTQKIILCRHRVQLEGGVRHDTLNARYDRVPVGQSEQYIVHHFKWVRGLDKRIEERLTRALIGGKYAAECRQFLNYYRTHGRIDLLDSRLGARYLGPLRYNS